MSISRVKAEADAAEAQIRELISAQATAPAAPTGDDGSDDNGGDDNGQQAAPANTPAPQAQQSAPPSSSSEVEWQHRYQTLQGMFARVNQENATLRGRLDELSARVNTVAPPVQPTTPAKSTRLLSEDELKDYGTEFIDVTKRAAREVYDARFDQMADLVKELQAKVASQQVSVQQVAQHTAESVDAAFYRDLATGQSNWQEVNTDPKFLTWLNGIDTFTGASRQALLNQAYNARDAHRTLAFFKAFTQSQGSGEAPTKQPVIDAASLVSPTSSAPAPTPSNPRRGKYWTQAEVEKVYEDRIRGKLTSAEFEASEKDLLAAIADGRIR